ncbi:family 43 glycosylhydrolase [Flammeovirga sp. MY04]|uniref:family 43 glycosylhydrolase n=1 Tax=Flammeovirga sp. MY04 TaxID=1191459 RepID=UPI00080611A8|nr:family 43 glycosylhydrolase [Flammeovirga sp. MY04]ANQ47438.1 family 43 glycosylhydrolase [Flammeovirga sp. MY04]
MKAQKLIIVCLLILGNTMMLKAQNPFITHKFTADPSARVFNDRLYVYTSHDEDDATYFDMRDWAVFSSKDVKNWKEHPIPFSLKDIAWADTMAWAPDCVHRNGQYYFYYPVERIKIGVAVGDRPEGPFKDVLGKPIIDFINEPNVGPEPIDPNIFIDDDGQAYMYFGCRYPKVTRLKENMIERSGELIDIKILDQDGQILEYIEKKEGEENIQANYGGDGVYGEAPWLFKRNGIYYFTYANGWSKDATMVYATSDSPTGPFTYQGKVMQPVSSSTSHGSVVEFKGDWYVFYHTMDISGKNFKRSICVDKLFFDKNGKIITVTPTREGI